MLNFENAKILSLSVENKFFGDAFRYASQKNLTIQGSLYDLTNDEGVEGVWSGISGVISDANDYDDIQLRGVSFGPGRIDNVQFSEGIDVRQKDYRIAVTIFSSGNLFNMTGAYYSGIDMSKAHLIDRMSESFDFSVDAERNYRFDQNVTCKFNIEAASQDAIQYAKAFASGLFLSQPEFGFINSEFSGFYNASGVRTFRETYDLISKECSFTKSMELPSNASGSYSIRFSYQVNTDNDGVTTVEERATIQGLTDPRSVGAEEGYTAAIGGAHARCLEEFSVHAPAGAHAMNSTRIGLSKRVDTFNGTIEYTASYNNDPRLSAGTNYSWEYEQELRREGCVYNVIEKGVVRGLSTTCTYADRYAHANGGYTTIKAGIESRLNAFGAAAGGGNAWRKTLFGEERSIYQGEISYSAAYTNQLASTAVANTIRKVESEVQDDMPVHLINTFIAYGFNGRQGKEIAQPAGIATPGQKSAVVKVYGFRSVAKNTLLDAAKDALNTYAPDGDDTFINSCGYSYDATENVVTAKVAWSYFSDWNFNTLKA